jgi:hypothetical protein
MIGFTVKIQSVARTLPRSSRGPLQSTQDVPNLSSFYSAIESYLHPGRAIFFAASIRLLTLASRCAIEIRSTGEF